MKVFRNDSRHVGRCYLLDAGAIAFQKICGIPIKFIRHALSQDLVWSIEIENEGIQDGVLGACDLSIGYWFRLEFVDLCVKTLYGFDRGATLRAQYKLLDSGMIEAGPNAAANGVGEPLRRAKTLHQS